MTLTIKHEYKEVTQTHENTTQVFTHIAHSNRWDKPSGCKHSRGWARPWGYTWIQTHTHTHKKKAHTHAQSLFTSPIYRSMLPDFTNRGLLLCANSSHDCFSAVDQDLISTVKRRLCSYLSDVTQLNLNGNGKKRPICSLP